MNRRNNGEQQSKTSNPGATREDIYNHLKPEI